LQAERDEQELEQSIA